MAALPPESDTELACKRLDAVDQDLVPAAPDQDFLDDVGDRLPPLAAR